MRLQLQLRIRQSAVNFVKETLFALPDVPTEEEFEELKRRRIQDAAIKVSSTFVLLAVRRTLLARDSLRLETLCFLDVFVKAKLQDFSAC